jgi:two-component system phosphate regulon sensor histidine kinase PhoR
MKPKILVVDDEPEAVELVEFNLKQAGFDVATAADGAEALKKARSVSPALILLDLMLPEIDGLEVCKLLRRDPTTADIPILMLTAKAAEIDRVLGLELGADDYVTKPFSPRELVLRIRKILDRRKPAGEKRETIRCGDLQVDVPKHLVTWRGKSIELTASGNTTTSLTRGRWTRTCAGCGKSSVPRQSISTPSVASVIAWSNPEFAVWPALTALALVALAAVHLWWRERLRREREAWRAKTGKIQGQVQTASAESRAQRDALFDSMAEGVLVLDAEGRVQVANRAFAQLFNTTGDLRGKALLETLRSHEVAELVNRVGLEGRVLAHEMMLPGPEERWLQVNATAITGNDRRRLGTILVFHDLTRVRRLEHTREEFVANVSHELRTPLSLIKGYVETLLGGAKDNPEVATKFLQTIERNARRLDLLIQDLLAISELESGRVKLNLQAVALRPVVDEVFVSFKERAATRNVKLINALPDLTAQTDPDRLQQVFANLLDNAVKYGRDGGSVTVGGRSVEEGRVELFVQDDGPGIPAEALERVFERFYRVDKGRSREQGGTGLGLAIVKHIVQSHAGKVWVKSELGKGTTFFFTLPLSRYGNGSTRG